MRRLDPQKRTIGRFYNLSGAEPCSFDDIIDTASAAIGRKRWKLHIPIPPVVALLRIYERLFRNPRLKAEQILRLNEDKAFAHKEAAEDFGFTACTFMQGIQRQVQRSNATY